MKDVAKLVNIRVSKVPVQSMVVNGQEQVVMGDAFSLVCPECGQVVQQFQVGATRLDILKALNTDDESKLNGFIYCAKCGQKLRIMRPMPIEIESVEVKVEGEIENNA